MLKPKQHPVLTEIIDLCRESDWNMLGSAGSYRVWKADEKENGQNFPTLEAARDYLKEVTA